MNLKSYLASLERGGSARFAEALDISASYLSQLGSGTAALSPARCVTIERVTEGLVTRKELRPDDWKTIWPELEGQHCCISASKVDSKE